MYLSLLSSPLFPSAKTMGLAFHSVEFSFFLTIFMIAWMATLWMLRNGLYVFVLDKVFYLCVMFVVICIYSMPDAPNKIRSAIVIGQYLPYFVLMYMVIVIVDSEDKLNKVLRALIHLAMIYSVIVFVAALIYNDRTKLDNFLLDNFVTETTKVLMYIELIYSIVVYRAFHSRLTRYETVFLIFSTLAVLASGGRTNIAIIVGIIGLSFLRSRSFIRKSIIILGVLCCTGIMFLSVDYFRTRLSLMIVTSKQDFDQKVTAFSRIYTTMLAMEVFMRHPINGTGIGNLSYFTGDTLKSVKGIPEPILRYWYNVHVAAQGGRAIYETTVTPVKFMAEMGIPGLAFYLLFYYYLWRRASQAIKITSGSFRITLSGMRVFVVAAFVHGILDPGITNYYSWFFYGLVIAGCRLPAKSLIATDSGGGAGGQSQPLLPPP
jgi:hypothetical protein